MSSESSELNTGSFRGFSTFVTLWAVSALVHQLAFSFWVETWQGWVLVFSACVALFRPDCAFRFTVLIVASLLNLSKKLPFVPNHILLEGMLHFTMLLALAGFFLRGAGRDGLRPLLVAWKPNFLIFAVAVVAKILFVAFPYPPLRYVLGPITTFYLLYAIGRMLLARGSVPGGEIPYARFTPVIRVAVVLVYWWAVLQKLNVDYFNPDVSCAARLHLEIAQYFGPLVPTAQWALYGAIYGSLAFEIGIPLLLLCRRTRYLGFVAAVFFHLWLSIHPAAGIFSFTSLILALLFLFLPDNWFPALSNNWTSQLRWLGQGDLARGQLRGRRLVLIAFFATLITQGGLYLVLGRTYEVFHIANRIGFWTFFVWGCWLAANYLIAGWQSGRKTDGWSGAARPAWVWLGLVPIVLNGALPWLGSKTQTSFSMYSNLRSEGVGNHLFLKRIDLFDYQTDMVEVLHAEPSILGPSSKPKGIQQFANLGLTLLPWFEFRRIVSEFEGDFEVLYWRHEEELTLGRKDGKMFGDETAFVKHPLLLSKWLWFRRLDSLDGPMPCTH
jgi:hypothetical protein